MSTPLITSGQTQADSAAFTLAAGESASISWSRPLKSDEEISVVRSQDGTNYNRAAGTAKRGINDARNWHRRLRGKA